MSYAHAMSYDHSMSYDHTISYAYPQCLFISDDIVSLRTCGANKHYAQGPARKHTSFTAIIENDDFFPQLRALQYTVHKKYEDRGCTKCKLLPVKLALSEQESFAQKKDMIHPRGIQLASLGIQDQSSGGEKALNRCRRCWGSQVPEHEFQCKSHYNLLWIPGMVAPPRPVKHPEILTLALPRPAPQEKNLPCPSLGG